MRAASSSTWPMYERCRALLAAGRGRPEEAEQWAARRRLRRAREKRVRYDELEGCARRGIAALLARDAPRGRRQPAQRVGARAARGRRRARCVPGRARPRRGARGAGRDRRGPGRDGAPRRARRGSRHIRGRWHRRAAAPGSSSSPASAGEEGATALAEAADDYRALGLRFDERAVPSSRPDARLRRLKKWAAARERLEAAAGLFDEIGSEGWAEEARTELSRVGARRPAAAGALTPTERRISELAANGLSNKEIASTLFVTVHTVEVHLSHAYAKLGIRSRSQLAARL